MVRTDGVGRDRCGHTERLAAGLYTITNTTITRHNIKTLSKTVDFIAGLGVNAFAMNGIIYSGEAKSGKDAVTEKELEMAALREVSDAAARNNLRFIWYTPTQYCKLDPMDLSSGSSSARPANTTCSSSPTVRCSPARATSSRWATS